MSTPTPHINAKNGDFAEVVLMPGDPLRAKFIAETFLQDAKLVTDVRNMYGYTGTYKGKKISVMGHGMGMPSISIYATELFKFYDVKKIIRVGSAGGISRNVKIRDIIIATSASTDSKINRIRFKNNDFAATASYGLTTNLVSSAKNLNINFHIGSIFSADLFYTPDTEMFDIMEKYNILAVEMEAAALFPIAAELNKEAACILTVSDHIKTGESTSSEERQLSFTNMMKIALDAAIL